MSYILQYSFLILEISFQFYIEIQENKISKYYFSLQLLLRVISLPFSYIPGMDSDGSAHFYHSVSTQLLKIFLISGSVLCVWIPGKTR